MEQTKFRGGGGGFDDLYRRHLALVQRIARSRLSDHAFVDEAVQDTFVRVYKRWRKGDHEPPVAFLAGKACTDVLRRHKVRLQRVVPVDPGDLVTAHHSAGADTYTDTASAVFAAERRAAIREVMGTLAERDREVLVRRVVAGEPYEAIARRTGASLDSLRSSMKRARAKFRESYTSLADARELWGAAVGGPLRRLRLRVRHARTSRTLPQPFSLLATAADLSWQTACAVGLMLLGSQQVHTAAGDRPHAPTAVVVMSGYSDGEEIVAPELSARSPGRTSIRDATPDTRGATGEPTPERIEPKLETERVDHTTTRPEPIPEGPEPDGAGHEGETRLPVPCGGAATEPLCRQDWDPSDYPERALGVLKLPAYHQG